MLTISRARGHLFAAIEWTFQVFLKIKVERGFYCMTWKLLDQFAPKFDQNRSISSKDVGQRIFFLDFEKSGKFQS